MFKKLYDCAEKERSEVVFYWYSKFDDLTQTKITIRPNEYLVLLPEKKAFYPLNYSDCLFQFSGSEAWKYLFRTDFIRRFDLKFAQTTCGEDIVFTMPARALANRMVFYNEVLVYYRVHTKNQLSNRFDIASQLKKSYKQAWAVLKKYKLQKVLKKSFKKRKEVSKLWVKQQKKELPFKESKT